MRLSWVVFLGAALAHTVPVQSYAQSRCDAIAPVRSAGLTVAITKILAQNNVITIQLLISNNTNGRVYLKSALWGDSAKAFLSSGPQLYTPTSTNIETTEGATGTVCLNNASCTQNLSNFSYIEPNDSLTFSLRYNSQTPAHQDDRISFPIIMVARFSRPTDTQDHAGAPQVVRFSFNSIPVGC